MMCYAAYTYLITDFMDVLALLHINKVLGSEPIVASIVAVIVHGFLAYRIWTLNKRFAPLSVVITVLSVAGLALGCYATVRQIRSTSFAILEEASFNWIDSVIISLTVTADVMISTTISYQLYRSRTGIPSTERMINALTLCYIITTGIIPAVLNGAELIAYEVAPTCLAFLVFEMLITKAYVNTCMVTLNLRQSIHGKSLPDALLSIHRAGELPALVLHARDPPPSSADDTDDMIMSAIKSKSTILTCEQCGSVV
ncbi:uncharacterized protein B0H18DRAFT_231844 [Fomitopsis serialis]|uniref:uncharacterized protein n=1 Tax=Fomitopsis serialis TaxID=139415 RepID=UPI002007BF39|nr:uncharacterized protein B0H18DRAFT_231844 [Neoantrodia serialis]KAH9928844.1 hypothetical protein B0H18DRAFT_231844 [Neoantrodia serialis]